MTDQNNQFFAILTAVGEAKQANADALGVPWTFAQMGIGDANGTDPIPSRTQTKLINERRRAPLNQVKVDPRNASVIIAEQIIPESIGGWWIREIGLYDAAGDLVAIANCAPTFKPLLSQGSGRTQVIRINLIVSSTSNIELKIDPSVVLATREYVDTSITNVLPPTREDGTYTKVLIDKRGVVLKGYNPTTLEGYSIEVATKLEAEAQVDQDNSKPMTALRVFQAIQKRVTQATELAFGWAKVANQQQVEAGVDDATFVTPKKLRFGFQILKATNGYIIFPSWLGGLIIQWGRVGFIAEGYQTFNFTIPFPNASLIGVSGLGDSVIYEWSSQPFCSLLLGGSKSSAQALSRYLSNSSLQYIIIGH